jgi:hypothetical protein
VPDTRLSAKVLRLICPAKYHNMEVKVHSRRLPLGR